MQLQNQQQLATKTIQQKLVETLGKIDRPGSFSSHGSLSPVLPGLEILGVGAVSFPLAAGQAEEIKQHFMQAPYGKGEQTLVDTNVRQVWRMTPDRFQLTNPEWQEFLMRILKTVEEELGLEDHKLESHLYNLLLYEKGSFFLPHRDGEKLDRMVATLVVALPSAFQGGELIIRHEGQQKTIDFGSQKNCPFQTHYVAFYADCEHEVKPLREGYRLCLVYNLTLTSKKMIAAPRNLEHIDTVASLLREWSLKSNDSPIKLAIMLDHQYSQDGLAWDILKGVDRTKAHIVREAARKAHFQVHLAQLTFWEQGSAEYSGERRGHWYNDDDDYDGHGNYTMEDVIDSSLTAEHWMDDEGHRLELDPMIVEEDEVVPEGVLTDVEPEEDVEGFTGNEGITLERWYRHAAIFLWPAERHFEVLCNCSTKSAITALNLLARQWQNGNLAEQPLLKAQCLEFATRIIEKWDSSPHFESADVTEPCQFVPALELLGNLNLLQAFLSEVMPRDASVELTASFIELLNKYGWSNFSKRFESIFQSATLKSLRRNSRLLKLLCLTELPLDEERRQLCVSLGQKLVSALATIDKAKDDWQTEKLKRTLVLVELVQSLIAIEDFAGLSELTAYTLSNPQRYSLQPVLVQTLLNLKDWLPEHSKQLCAVTEWISACLKHLEALTAQIPQEPSDFKREAEISCRCADCKELIEFLKNPGEKVHRFSVRKDRRQHLHQIIEKHNCDTDHVTERKGSPQTLVCTKNINSFQRNLKKYLEDKENLAALQALEKNLLSVWQ